MRDWYDIEETKRILRAVDLAILIEEEEIRAYDLAEEYGDRLLALAWRFGWPEEVSFTIRQAAHESLADLEEQIARASAEDDWGLLIEEPGDYTPTDLCRQPNAAWLTSSRF